MCEPLTGKVERLNLLPFENKPQYRSDAFCDNFYSNNLDPEWNFQRVPKEGTYSLTEKGGYLRLFAKPDVIKERGSCSLMGFRQKESDFEYSARMVFTSEMAASEAGICLFQNDNNYFTLTVIRRNGQSVIQLKLAEPGKVPEIFEEKKLEENNGEIIFKVESKEHQHHFMFSLDNGETFSGFATTKANYLLSDCKKTHNTLVMNNIM